MNASVDPLYAPLLDSIENRDPTLRQRRPYQAFFWAIWSFYLGLGIALFVFVPKFSEIFRQVDVALPTVTTWVILLSDYVCAYPLAWVGGTLLLSLFMARLPRTRKQEVWIFSLALFGLISNFGLIIVGMFLPLLGTLEVLN